MDVPASAAQLLILLLFVLPGSVYQAVRQQLRGPAPDDLNFSTKLFRALGVSTGLIAVYVAVAGPSLVHLTEVKPGRSPSWEGIEAHARLAGCLAIVLLLIVPALLGLINYLRVARTWSLRGLTYEPVPRAWDYTFGDIEPCYVRVLTTDGRWFGGWFGERSFVSSFPEPREIYIETAHVMKSDGSFGVEQTASAGIYVRCDDIRVAELLRPPVHFDVTDEEGGVDEH
jgi:hypothetical protein